MRRSQNPLHYGARSIVKFCTILFFTMWCLTSSDLIILQTSLAEDLKLWMLSNKDEGSPLQLENLQNACRNDWTSSPKVSSKWTTLVDWQVNKQMYVLHLSQSVSKGYSKGRFTNNGPAKSIPTWPKGGSSKTLVVGKSGGSKAWNGGPSSFLHNMQPCRTFFTVACPLKIQNL